MNLFLHFWTHLRTHPKTLQVNSPLSDQYHRVSSVYVYILNPSCSCPLIPISHLHQNHSFSPFHTPRLTLSLHISTYFTEIGPHFTSYFKSAFYLNMYYEHFSHIKKYFSSMPYHHVDMQCFPSPLLNV